MNYATVCSGIETPSIAFKELGWKLCWVSETDSFCNAVIEHHYPGIPNLGDATKIIDEDRLNGTEEIDVIVAGTPCQSFSIAGNRGGLDDARATLPSNFLGLLQRFGHAGSFGKMSLEPSPRAKAQTSESLPTRWLSAGIQSPGESLMLRLPDHGHIPSHYHNEGSVSLLSDVLETTGDHLPRYYLSRKACVGILHRSAERKRKLPTHLYQALARVAYPQKNREES